MIRNQSPEAAYSALRIDFSPKTLGQWQQLLSQCPQANWLQAWPYAMASFKRDHYRTKLASILRGDQVIGVFAIQEIKLGPIHLVNLSRGPLWLKPSQDSSAEGGNSISGREPNSQLSDFQDFALKFAEMFPRRWLRRRRWLVESDSQEVQQVLQKAGFKKRTETYSTVWLNLKIELADLRASLHRKWRNYLNKSERADLQIHFEKISYKNSKPRVNAFVASYESYKEHKGFPGPSGIFMQEEILEAAKMENAFFVSASKNQQEVAGMYFQRHGQNVSYRMGWNSQLGRQNCGHYSILWQAICEFKKMGILRLDLGGILPEDAEGLTEFKLRTGGQISHSIGIYD